MSSLIMYFIMMVMLIVGLIYVGIIMITDEIKSRKQKEQEKLNKVRRDQLVKEMKAGTFNEKEAEDMVNELADIIYECGDWIRKSEIEMTKKHSGIIQLTTYRVNGHSRI